MSRTLSVVLLGLLALAGAAAATAATSDGDILGCVGDGSGLLRVVGSHDECRGKEDPIALAPAGDGPEAGSGLLSVIPFLGPGVSNSTCRGGAWTDYRCDPANAGARAWRLDMTSLQRAERVEFTARVRTGWSGYVCVRLYDLSAEAAVPGTELCHLDERPVPEDPETHDGPSGITTRLVGEVGALPGEAHEFIVQTRGRPCEETEGADLPCGYGSGSIETAELVVTP